MNGHLPYNEISSMLNCGSSVGNKVSDSGAIFLGHMPEVAPKAYLHVIYPPIDEKSILELNEILKPAILHSSLIDFFRFANGMNLFFKKGFRVFGYVSAEKRVSEGFFDYPDDILHANGDIRIKGSESNEITIGWYLADSSYVNLDECGRVVRFNPSNPKKIIQCWPDIKSWLISEIERLNNDFSHVTSQNNN